MTQAPNPELFKPLSELKLWPENYNSGDIGSIARSIVTFGFRNAIRVWQDNMVMAGNHTVMALMSVKAGGPLSDSQRPDDAPYSWPPVGVVSHNGEWYVRYVDCSDMTYTQAKAFAIADNETARKAVRDDLKLAELLVGIYQESKGLGEATAVSADELDQLVGDLAAESKYGADDILPEPDDDLLQGQDSKRPYIIYVSFATYDEFATALRLLSDGERTASDTGQFYAQVDGSEQMERLKRAFADES